MSNFNNFKLRTNPFRLTPAINSDELIWAGFPSIKSKFELRIKRSMQIPNSSLILNWGEYGSGKTHAARYFNKYSVLNSLAEETTQKAPYSININFPKSKQLVFDIYTQIIDKLDIADLRGKFAELVSDGLIFNEITDNILIRNILKLFFDASVSENQIKQYLYKTISSTDLQAFNRNGIQRTLSSDDDFTEFLAAFFTLLTLDKKVYSCVIIWLDEFEDISILNTAGIGSINNFLRHIIDKTPNNLLIFINLTLSAMIGYNDLGDYLQEAVKSRIKDTIELPIPTHDDLKIYLKELLNNPIYRTEVVPDEFSPFQETVIDELIKDLNNVSLRRFNEAFSLLIESAAFENKKTIDLTYYITLKNELLGWKV